MGQKHAFVVHAAAQDEPKAESSEGSAGQSDGSSDEPQIVMKKPAAKTKAKSKAKAKSLPKAKAKNLKPARRGRPPRDGPSEGAASFARRMKPATKPSSTRWQAIVNVFRETVAPTLKRHGAALYCWEECAREI